MPDDPRASAPLPLPSDAELRILRHLWRRGEQSVREIHERLAPDWDVGYTTVLKLLQRMHEKGVVERRREGRAHLYRAVVEEETTERRVVRSFADRTMEGSLKRLIQRALPEEAATEEDLREIRRLLDEWQGEG